MKDDTNPMVLKQLKNDNGETYFVVVKSENPARFVRELWESVSKRLHGCPQDDDEASKEWTDRIRSYRTTVSHEGACIRTHAWSPEGDKQELHSDVLSYLRSNGLDV